MRSAKSVGRQRAIPLCPRPSLAPSQRPGLAPTLIQMSKSKLGVDDREDEFWRGHPHWQRKSSRHSQWRAGRARRERKAAPIGGQRTGKRFRLRCRPRAAAKARCTLLELVSRPHRHAGDRAGCSCRRSRRGPPVLDSSSQPLCATWTRSGSNTAGTRTRAQHRQAAPPATAPSAPLRVQLVG
jgi:hypothetical protein